MLNRVTFACTHGMHMTSSNVTLLTTMFVYSLCVLYIFAGRYYVCVSSLIKPLTNIVYGLALIHFTKLELSSTLSTLCSISTWLEVYFEWTLFNVMPIVFDTQLMTTNLPWNDLVLVMELLFVTDHLFDA